MKRICFTYSVYVAYSFNKSVTRFEGQGLNENELSKSVAFSVISDYTNERNCIHTALM